MKSRFTYRVVTSNGSGRHGGEFGRCVDARKAAERFAEIDRKERVKFGPFEIERIEHFHGSGRGVNYWMRKRSHWVQWNAHEDIDFRQPDWRYE